MTQNEQIIHDLLTRQIDLMRYERSVRREVLQRLEVMRREVEDKLRGRNLDEMGRRELAALLADIEAILRRDYDLISGSLNTAEVVEDESEWLFVWLGGMAAMYGLPEPKRLPETHKQALQNGLLVGGLTIAEAFAGQRDALMRRIRAQVRMAAVGGSDWESLKTDLQAAFKRAIQHAETTTATWISTLANQTAYWAGKANPWVKGYRHISVLDSKTSSVCTNRHGKLWDKHKQPQGHDFEFRVPPIHPNCRSRLVWVADLEEDFQGVSGEDWVKGRTLSQLQEQFGKGIGQMLYDGDITLADAVKQGGLVPVTLRELKRKFDPFYIVPLIDTNSLQGARFTQSQLKRKFKHASYFGIDVRKSNPQNWKAYQEAVIAHLNDNNTVLYGSYRQKGSKVFYNGQTDIAVAFSDDNIFITAIRVTGDQRKNYLKNGYLQ